MQIAWNFFAEIDFCQSKKRELLIYYIKRTCGRAQIFFFISDGWKSTRNAPMPLFLNSVFRGKLCGNVQKNGAVGEEKMKVMMIKWSSQGCLNEMLIWLCKMRILRHYARLHTRTWGSKNRTFEHLRWITSFETWRYRGVRNVLRKRYRTSIEQQSDTSRTAIEYQSNTIRILIIRLKDDI